MLCFWLSRTDIVVAFYDDFGSASINIYIYDDKEKDFKADSTGLVYKNKEILNFYAVELNSEGNLDFVVSVEENNEISTFIEVFNSKMGIYERNTLLNQKGEGILIGDFKGEGK